MTARRSPSFTAPRHLALGLAVLLGAGCTSPVASRSPQGTARFVLAQARQVQYLASQVQALKLTVSSQTTSQSYAQILSAAGGRSLSYQVLNLPAGRYVARLEAYLDREATQTAGLSTSTPFTIDDRQTTTIQMPALTLAATPLGDWRMTLNASLSGGYSITRYQCSLQNIDGTSASGPSGGAFPATSATFTWGNVPASPAGLSTTSITMSARRKGKTVTKTQVATVDVQAGATVSSVVSFSFP